MPNAKELVEIHHEGLDQTVTVPRSTAEVLARRGWQPTAPEAAPSAATRAPAPPPPPTPTRPSAGDTGKEA